MYDEDNIDLEEQLYLQEIQEELESEEYADIENEEEDENEDEFEQYDYKLTKSFLETQLRRYEPDRTYLKIIHKPTRKIFEGYVLGQSSSNSNKFVFLVAELVDDALSEKKTKVFNIDDIKKYK